jgi:hypothetical protein
MSEWISVEDRLPKRNERVLAAWNNKKDVIFCSYYGNKAISVFVDRVKERTVTVTHWMPLPEPPK